jgi:hypothetical protein
MKNRGTTFIRWQNLYFTYEAQFLTCALSTLLRLPQPHSSTLLRFWKGLLLWSC